MESKNYALETLQGDGSWVVQLYYPSQAHRLLSGNNSKYYRIPNNEPNTSKNRGVKKPKIESEPTD